MPEIDVRPSFESPFRSNPPGPLLQSKRWDDKPQSVRQDTSIRI